jgi:iron complex outermembrane receptor protein
MDLSLLDLSCSKCSSLNRSEYTQTFETRITSHGDFAADSFGTYLEYEVSGRSDPFDYVVNASWETFGFTFDRAGDRIPLSGIGPENGRAINLLGKFGASDEVQRLPLTVNYFDNTNAVEYINDPDIDSDPDANKARAIRRDIEFIGLDDTGEREYTIVNLTYSHEDVFGSRLEAQDIYRSNFNRIAEPFVSRGDAVVAQQESGRFGSRLQVDTPFSDQFSLLWGADYSWEESSQPYFPEYLASIRNL